MHQITRVPLYVDFFSPIFIPASPMNQSSRVLFILFCCLFFIFLFICNFFIF